MLGSFSVICSHSCPVVYSALPVPESFLDIRAIARITHQASAQLLVDSTFATPVLQRPLTLGADVVLHSTTKYCGGHSYVQRGWLVVKTRELRHPLMRIREVLGAVAAPFNSWLIQAPFWTEIL